VTCGHEPKIEDGFAEVTCEECGMVSNARALVPSPDADQRGGYYHGCRLCHSRRLHTKRLPAREYEELPR
jgi:hypothetical protein